MFRHVLYSLVAFSVFAIPAVSGCSSEADDPTGNAEDAIRRGKRPETRPVCPAVVTQCPAGQRAADLNGDGCALECEDVVCPLIAPPSCPAGQRVADVDGDGCALECEDVVCILLPPSCPPGQQPADVDGDGCALECQ